MTNHEIACGNCGKVFGHSPEAPDLAPEDERSPCPDCGSKARSVSATVAPDTIRAQVKVFSPAITQTSTGVSGVPDEAVGVLIAMRWTLYRYEPTVPDGSYTYMLHDAEGKLLAIAEHFEADTALLAVIEEVLPASEK